jgi:hypothetical protein
MTKGKLIELMKVKSTEIINNLKTDENKKEFTSYLIDVNKNENYKYTLNFIEYCSNCKEYLLFRRDKDLLLSNYKSIMETLNQFNNWEYIKRQNN